MLVEDLKADDMQMIRDYVIIYFTKTPTIDPIHTLTVEWTTVEGEVKTASLTCRRRSMRKNNLRAVTYDLTR